MESANRIDSRALQHIESEITDLEIEIEQLNLQIEKKVIAINAYKKARRFLKEDQENNSEEDTGFDESEFEGNENQDNNDVDESQNEMEFENDPDEIIPEEETKIMKNSFAWKAKEALRQSRRPMKIAEIAKFCKYDKKQRETMGVIISQYERTGKIFIKIEKGVYGLKAFKSKY